MNDVAKRTQKERGQEKAIKIIANVWWHIKCTMNICSLSPFQFRQLLILKQVKRHLQSYA